jgi:hypothetical protein
MILSKQQKPELLQKEMKVKKLLLSSLSLFFGAQKGKT